MRFFSFSPCRPKQDLRRPRAQVTLKAWATGGCKARHRGLASCQRNGLGFRVRGLGFRVWGGS